MRLRRTGRCEYTSTRATPVVWLGRGLAYAAGWDWGRGWGGVGRRGFGARCGDAESAVVFFARRLSPSPWPSPPKEYLGGRGDNSRVLVPRVARTVFLKYALHPWLHPVVPGGTNSKAIQGDC